MDEYLKFRDFYLVSRSELLLANNYICAQLNSSHTHYKYYSTCTLTRQNVLLFLNGKIKMAIIKLQDLVVTGFFAVAANKFLITILKKIYMFFLVVDEIYYE